MGKRVLNRAKSAHVKRIENSLVELNFSRNLRNFKKLYDFIDLNYEHNDYLNSKNDLLVDEMELSLENSSTANELEFIVSKKEIIQLC